MQVFTTEDESDEENNEPMDFLVDTLFEELEDLRIKVTIHQFQSFEMS